MASTLVQELYGPGITVAEIEKAGRNEIQLLRIALMSAITAENPFSENLNVGRAAGRRKSGNTNLDVLQNSVLGT